MRSRLRFAVLPLLLAAALVGCDASGFEAEQASVKGTLSPYVAGLDEVTHIAGYGGCSPSYTLQGASVDSWSITGSAVLTGNNPQTSGLAIVATTGFGSFTITAHYGSSQASKTVIVNRFQREQDCP